MQDKEMQDRRCRTRRCRTDETTSYEPKRRRKWGLFRLSRIVQSPRFSLGALAHLNRTYSITKMANATGAPISNMA
jgi:hypothetical protein